MIHTALKLLTAPAAEPVDTATLAAHTKVDGTSETELLSVYIAAARKWVEEASGRQLMTATYRLSLDRFPSPIAGTPIGVYTYRADVDPLIGMGIFEPGSVAIRLPRAPLASITSVQYADPIGTIQTLDPATYQVDSDSEPGRVTPAVGAQWPGTRLQANAVQITYTAGYGATPAQVPAGYRLAIMQLAAHWYRRREAVTDGQWGEVPLGVRALVMTDRVKGF